MQQVEITYYSDVLCVWAYVAQRRLEELEAHFEEQVRIIPRYCSVFPDAWGKIEGRGGFDSFNVHVRNVAEQFPHISVSEDIWLKGRPRTSASPHQFLKAVELVERENGGEALPYSQRLSARAAWSIRHAFFAEARDIGDWDVQRDIADTLGIDTAEIEKRLRSSQALAALAIDYAQARDNGIKGSPTFAMNDGRQVLFGNVGYRLLEANVQELLRRPKQDEASWC